MVDASETQEDDEDHDDIDEDDFHEAAHHDFSTPAASLFGDHDTMLGERRPLASPECNHVPDPARCLLASSPHSLLLAMTSQKAARSAVRSAAAVPHRKAPYVNPCTACRGTFTEPHDDTARLMLRSSMN